MGGLLCVLLEKPDPTQPFRVAVKTIRCSNLADSDSISITFSVDCSASDWHSDGIFRRSYPSSRSDNEGCRRKCGQCVCSVAQLSLVIVLVRELLASLPFGCMMTLSPVHWGLQQLVVTAHEKRLWLVVLRRIAGGRGEECLSFEEFFKDFSHLRFASSGTFLSTVTFYSCIVRGLHAGEPCGGILPGSATQLRTMGASSWRAPSKTW